MIKRMICAAAAALAMILPGAGQAADMCSTIGATQAFDYETRCVSSVLSPQSGNRYDIHSLTDDNPATAWCEGRNGHGQGETITLNWGNAAPLQAILIQNGYAKSNKSWSRNSRIRDIRITLHLPGGPRSITVTLADTPDEQKIALPWSRTTPIGAHIEILSVWPGTHYTDTCVSGLSTDFGF